MKEIEIDGKIWTISTDKNRNHWYFANKSGRSNFFNSCKPEERTKLVSFKLSDEKEITVIISSTGEFLHYFESELNTLDQKTQKKEDLNSIGKWLKSKGIYSKVFPELFNYDYDE